MRSSECFDTFLFDCLGLHSRLIAIGQHVVFIVDSLTGGLASFRRVDSGVPAAPDRSTLCVQVIYGIAPEFGGLPAA
jgi:hypothetical protein